MTLMGRHMRRLDLAVCSAAAMRDKLTAPARKQGRSARRLGQSAWVDQLMRADDWNCARNSWGCRPKDPGTTSWAASQTGRRRGDMFPQCSRKRVDAIHKHHACICTRRLSSVAPDRGQWRGTQHGQTHMTFAVDRQRFHDVPAMQQARQDAPVQPTLDAGRGDQTCCSVAAGCDGHHALVRTSSRSTLSAALVAGSQRERGTGNLCMPHARWTSNPRGVLRGEDARQGEGHPTRL